jgi:NAD(P)-dependent dehydrogenase (short-subunit alcohol dehydrogenase family)
VITDLAEAVDAAVAVVTGAGSGIGRAVSCRLASEGFAVVLSGRRREALDETAALCSDASTSPVTVFPADVTSPASVETLFDFVRATFGRVDLLFNNAGVFGATSPIDEVELADWHRVLETNVTGSFLCARAAFALMKSQDPSGGRIINNGSLSAHVPRMGSVAYTASKHAVTGLTKALSLEGRDFGIACGQIDVGNARTEMTALLDSEGPVRAEPTIDVSHVAEAVAYMGRLPLEANVQFLTVMATGMPFIGRG